MPRDLFHGGWVDARLVITTSDYVEYSETMHLWVERLSHRKQHPTRKSTLFEDVLHTKALSKTQVSDGETLEVMALC